MTRVVEKRVSEWPFSVVWISVVLSCKLRITPGCHNREMGIGMTIFSGMGLRYPEFATQDNLWLPQVSSLVPLLAQVKKTCAIPG